MSTIPTKQIDGDIAVGGNCSIGGNANIQGCARVGHDLIVEGWLEAKNIRGANKGLFASLATLREAYPHPHYGWFAGVSASEKDISDLGLTSEQGKAYFKMYIGIRGEWVCEPINKLYEIVIAHEDVSDLRNDLASLSRKQADLEQRIVNLIAQLADTSDAKAASDWINAYKNGGDFHFKGFAFDQTQPDKAILVATYFDHATQKEKTLPVPIAVATASGAGVMTAAQAETIAAFESVIPNLTDISEFVSEAGQPHGPALLDSNGLISDDNTAPIPFFNGFAAVARSAVKMISVSPTEHPEVVFATISDGTNSHKCFLTPLSDGTYAAGSQLDRYNSVGESPFTGILVPREGKFFIGPQQGAPLVTALYVVRDGDLVQIAGGAGSASVTATTDAEVNQALDEILISE